MTSQPRTIADELRIAHATDLHPDGGIAFAHSVALATRGDGSLYSMHAQSPGEPQVRRMPEAQELLSTWRAHGADLHLGADRFHKVAHTCCDDPVDTLLDAMHNVLPNLLVVGKHHQEGMFKFLHDSVSESLALNAGIPTLFLPIGGRGFVDQKTGSLGLKRVLIPVADEPQMLPVFEVVEFLLERLDVDEAEFILLHVGKENGTLDGILTPEGRPGWAVTREARSGRLAEAIDACTQERSVDLIAMGTHGHDSLLDIFRGSNTQQVVRQSRCPVLWVPLDSRATS